MMRHFLRRALVVPRVVANQLHRSAVLNAGEQTARPPYFIFRFKPLAPGIAGH
jgi:hypothetical protein